jgi:hypothetical protein
LKKDGFELLKKSSAKNDGETGRRGDGARGWFLKEKIRSYKELRVYQAAMDAAMRIFELTKTFPIEEKYSMVDQMRRCSRSVCTNIGEAWRKRRYAAHFISKLSDSEGEAEEKRGCGLSSLGAVVTYH